MTKSEKIKVLEKIVRKNLISAGCYAGDDDIMTTYFPPSIKRLRKLAVITAHLSSNNNAEALRRFLNWYLIEERSCGKYGCPALLDRLREEYASSTPLQFSVNPATCPDVDWLQAFLRLWHAVSLSDSDAAYRVSVPFSGARWYRKGGKVDTF